MNKTAQFKDRLREIMQLNGIRACWLSRTTFIPKSTISCYLAGRMIPSADRLSLLAKRFNVSEQWLLGYDVPMQIRPTTDYNESIAKIIMRLKSDPDFSREL